MPTGPEHIRVDHIEELINDTLTDYEVCRCMIGVGHDKGGMTIRDYENEQDEDGYGEAISVYDAADIWTSSGGHEDYSFGYSNEELEGAADEGDFSSSDDAPEKRRLSFRKLFGR